MNDLSKERAMYSWLIEHWDLLLGVIFTAAIVVLLLGCTVYTVEDWVKERQRSPSLATSQPVKSTEIGRKSVARGLFMPVSAPVHGESKLDGTVFGGTSWSKIAQNNRSNILIGAGVVLLLGGAIMLIWLKIIGPGIVVGIVGGVLIFFGLYPAAVLIFPLLAVAGLLWFLWDANRRKKLQTAFLQTVAGVDAAKDGMVEDDARKEFNTLIQTKQDEETQKMVKKAKTTL